ncbi:MAG: hypothetical protein M1814_001180, partial [Vezdaea aestivalis]
DVEGNKEFLESRLDEQLREIEDERERLIKREQQVLKELRDDDQNYQTQADLALEQSLARILRPFQEMPKELSEDETLALDPTNDSSAGED